MAPTSPRQRVWISFLPPESGIAGATSTSGSSRDVKDGGAERGAQKMPRAALASSDIISGLHGGRMTISGRTSPTPGTAARKPRI